MYIGSTQPTDACTSAAPGANPIGAVHTVFLLGLLCGNVTAERGLSGCSDPYLQHCYCVGMDDNTVQLLTPEPAEHSVTFSPDGTVFVDAYLLLPNQARELLKRFPCNCCDGALD